MRKFHLIGLALFAVFAFSAIAVASASAELVFSLAQWLANGNLVTAELASETEGELLLENTTLKGSVLCSGILAGSVGPNSLDKITEVLSLSLVKIGAELVGTGLLCTADAGSACIEATEASPIEVWPDGLPWTTELELDLTDGTAWILIFKAGWDVLCLNIFGTMSEELCSAAEPVAIEVVNGATDVESPNEKVAEPNGNCGTGTGNALQESEGGLVLLVNGETLQVSE